MTFSTIRQTWYSRSISSCLIVTFVVSMLITPRASYAQEGVVGLPEPGTMVNLSPAYVPLMLTGLKVHPDNPLLMDFIVSTGNSNLSTDEIMTESDRLIKYFLACLAIPEKDQWVNLSPYEKQRIIPDDLGKTVLGQDMLEQDYILKQLTASLIYPEKNLGKNFWDKVYTQARQMYGSVQIPVNTFNKVWILPEYAKVYEHQDTVLVVKSHLKVMLDEDYLSLQKHGVALDSGSHIDTHSIGANIVRQIILPAIEQEVNHGQNFAQMRQIYNSMILAVWFKNNLKQAFLNQVYTNKAKVNGVNVDDPAIKEKIYQQYLRAYKKGVFNYIKEEVDLNSQTVIPRKYFSGGLDRVDPAIIGVDNGPEAVRDYNQEEPPTNKLLLLHSRERVLKEGPDGAMIAIERLSPQNIIDRFKLAYSDALYFSVLIAKYLGDIIRPVLGKNGIPSALLDKAARQQTFGVLDGRDILNDQANSEAAKQVHMRVLQLKGGLGTSFQRKATLLRLTGRETLADKGTDSYFENVAVEGFDASGQVKQFNENISVAELKLLYYIYLAQQKQFGEVEVQELVNAESQDAVSKFWDTVYLADRVDDRIPSGQKRTYRQIFNDPVKGIKGLHFNQDFILQGIMPVVDAQTGEYLNNESLRSPGGHAAFVALTMDDNSRNQKDLSVPRITVFTNGDGVNNMLPPAVAGWMVREKAPIVMVTTTKQLLDLKGGLITLLSNKDLPVNIQEKLARFETLSMEDIADLQTSLYPYLLEIAQAKAEGQQDIFQKMGITLGEKSAQFFNTNMHAQNHNVLDPFLAKLKGIIGDEKFNEIIGPDLIVNPKDKKVDGKPVKVIQLEGASGSALLAMNRFILTTTDPRVIALKEEYGISRLVYFVNFDEQLRSEVFTPEKYTWDHYLYAFTDLFSVDPVKGRLVFSPASGRSTLPGFDLDKPYEDLEYDINAFGRNLSVRALDYLAIRGEVRIPNAILKGGVFIRNRSGKVADLTALSNVLPSEGGRLSLSNIIVSIDEQGKVTTKPVTNLLETIEKFDKGDEAILATPDDGTADEATDVVRVDMTGRVLPAAVVQRVAARNQDVTVKTKGTAGWRSYMMSQLTKGDLNGLDAKAVLKDFESNGYADFEGVINPKNLPATIDDFRVSEQFASVKQQLFDILTAVAKEQGPLNEENLGRAASSSILQLQKMVRDGSYKLKDPARGLRVLVGYDGRLNADKYAEYVARVAGAYEGVSVDLSDDLIATPDGLQQTRRDEAYDLVLVLTASHNDYRYLGLKVGNDGGIADDNITGEIDKLANAPEGKQSFPILPAGTIFNRVDLKAKAMARYNAAFSGLPDAVRSYLQSKPNSIFVNFMHGSDGRYKDYFLAMGVPSENIQMVTPMRQGEYPQQMVVENGKKVFWRPQPVREMLEDQLKAFESDPNVPEGAVYLTIDGDADRFAVWQKLNGIMVQVTGNASEEISPNEMSLMFLDSMIKNNLVPEGVKRIVITRPTGKAVAKRAKIAGYDVIFTPVGSKYLKKYMNDSNNPQATLVFEESGHGGFRFERGGRTFNFFDDGLAQALFFLEIMTDIAKKGLTPVEYIRQIKQEINYNLVYRKIAVNATEAAKDKIRNALQPTPVPVRIMGHNITNVRELVSLVQGIVQGDKQYKVKQVLHTGANDSLVTTEQFEGGVKLNPNEGLNIEFDTGAEDNVWVEIRMSGTEPIIRIYGQFEDQQQADRVMKVMDEQFFKDESMSAKRQAMPILTTDDEEIDRAAAEDTTALEAKMRAVRPAKEKGQTFTGAARPDKKDRRDTAVNAEPGGIDLNSSNLNMESEGQKVSITFDAAMIAQFKRGDFSGVKVQILDIVPISIEPLLGMKEDEQSKLIG